MAMSGYEDLVREALDVPLQGWDFEWLQGRTSEKDPSWRYGDRVRALLPTARSLLDVDTGGGEFLADLAPLPTRTAATEGWEPNLPVARERLEPLGVEVLRWAGGRIPAPDQSFDLILNRHGRFDAAEFCRVLAPGGRLLSQQVGSDNCADLNEALGAAPMADTPMTDGGSWTLATAVEHLERYGATVRDAREELLPFSFYGIGAVVFYLRRVPWQIGDFDVDRYDRALRALHERIESEGQVTVHNHRFLVEAEMPSRRI